MKFDNFKENGYTVNLHLNELSANKAAGRAIKRFFTDGRFLDPALLNGVGNMPTQNYKALRQRKGYLDGYSHYSNDVKFGEQPIRYETNIPTKGTQDISNANGLRSDRTQEFHGDGGRKTRTQEAGRGEQPEITSSNNDNNNFGENTVGAAQSNPNSFSALANKYGTIKPGENPARIIDVPKRTSDDTKTRTHVRTVMEASAIPDYVVGQLEKDVANGVHAYEPISNKKALDNARDIITNKGFDEALKMWDNAVDDGRIPNANEVALGESLLVKASNERNIKLTKKLLVEVISSGTRAGQAVQAFRILKRMGPDGQLYSLQRQVSIINKDISERYNGTKPEVEIPDELAQKLLDSKTPEEIENAVDEINYNVSQQIPPHWKDKVNAWRYMCMPLR